MARKGQPNPNGGRKQFDGKSEELILAKLREAFLMDCTDSEACALAEISVDSYYRYLKAHPDFSQAKAQWKENPFLIARKSILEGMKTSPDLALKYMERKRREEFSERKEIIVDDSQRVEWSKAVLDNPEMADEISRLMGKIAKK